ncbi:hypothetical protein [Janthinobacterium sp. LB3P118]|uniref:hypothetical protein n=1 Tax=Janthinobacterium sp. LB3P118 TaxID=3424195 RepID=UPI003F1F9E73
MQLPVYTHPTLSVLIDDSDSFLKSLAFQLDPGLARKTFHDTSSVLHWLRHSTPLGEMPLHVNFDTQNLPPDQCNVALDLERIWRISAQAQRFAVPSVLVVDYSMPQMNGLEFCQRHGFVEFYIFPNPSGILFFTRDGHAKLMIIETERSLHTQYEMARDSDAPASLLLALLEMRVIPYFSDADSDGMYAAHIGENWFRYCAAPTICLGRVTYFWALFDVPPHQLGKPVTSYAQFLRAQAGESVGA